MKVKILKPEQTGYATDRISELPEGILHNVLSFLETPEVCRTSTLSKRWRNVWASTPVLNFHPKYFKEEVSGPFRCVLSNTEEYYDEETFQSYQGFIDCTMERYSKCGYSIEKLQLGVPMVNEKTVPMIDKWVEIAVQNGVQELDISILVLQSPVYTLPDILFSAKALKVLKCVRVEVPYYESMNLTYLQHLEARNATFDEKTLMCLIASCPLIELQLVSCSGTGNITDMPAPLNKSFVNAKESPSLTTFVYQGYVNHVWPFMVNADSLRNLKVVVIRFADIADEALQNLVAELALLEVLVLHSCWNLTCPELSSTRLKELDFNECDGLQRLRIDAPNLLSFWYTGQPELSLSLLPSVQGCRGEYWVPALSIDADWFVRLKEFLKETSIFKVFWLELCCNVCKIEDDVNELLEEINIGPPVELEEVRLPYTYEDFEPEGLKQSSVVALLDGLPWTCHPEVLIVTTNLESKGQIIEVMLKSLRNKAHCWKHPLKHIEVESADCSNLLERSEIEIRIRLYWHSL